jgi:hypothetical protein
MLTAKTCRGEICHSMASSPSAWGMMSGEDIADGRQSINASVLAMVDRVMGFAV